MSRIELVCRLVDDYGFDGDLLSALSTQTLQAILDDLECLDED